MNKKINSIICTALAFSMAAVGCSKTEKTDSSSSAISSESDENTSDLNNSADIGFDVSTLFSERDLSGDFDTPDAEIILNGDSVSCEGDGAEVDKTTITITKGGVYRFSGTLDNGKIVVNTGKDDKVQLVFDGVDLSSSDSSPLCILNADKTFITLVENSKNTLTDGKSRSDSDTENQPDSVIFSKDDLTINGSGSLVVNGNFNEGITTKNDLVIANSDVTVNAVGNGIKGGDSVALSGVKLDIASNSDGLKSNNADDTSKGFVYIENSLIKICSDEDGIQAESAVICDGDNDIQITSGGGFTANTDSHNDDFGGGFGGRREFGGQNERNMPKGGSMPDSEGRIADYKPPVFEGENRGNPQGFNGEAPPDFNGETPPEPPEFNGDIPENQQEFNGEAPPDFNGEMPPEPPDFDDDFSEGSSDEDTVSSKGIKSAGIIKICGGDFTIDSCDDAIHADGSIEISDGCFSLSSGDDAIHSDDSLDISGGQIDVITSYEGLEAAFINISGGDINVNASDDGINASDGTPQGGMGTKCDVDVTISGGCVNISADGDGIDSNGTMHFLGGEVSVTGPTNDGNSAIDGNGDILIDGGTFGASGSSGMLELPSEASKQNIVVIYLDEYTDENSKITILDENLESIYSAAPAKKFDSFIISTPDLQTGSTYTVLLNDSEIGGFTVEGTISTVGEAKFGGFGKGRGDKPPMPER